jgi:hypothetical protein
LLLGAVGRGLQEGVEVVVGRGASQRLVLGVRGGGYLVGLLKDLGLPPALGEQLASGLGCIYHGAARRPEIVYELG